jgi:hypothetical protein
MPTPDAAQLQITAGAALIHQSKLLEWSAGRFIATDEDTFEYSARHDIHPVFGRLICWLLFSAGAEYLAKGLCLAHDIPFAEPAEVAKLPDIPIATWLEQTKGYPKAYGTEPATNYKHLGTLTHSEEKKLSPLDQLAKKNNTSRDDVYLLLGAYRRQSATGTLMLTSPMCVRCISGSPESCSCPHSICS